jgi:hypothetical protein
MKDVIETTLGWFFPVMSMVLIVLVAMRPALRGRGWLLGYLSSELFVMLAWRTPALFQAIAGIDPSWVSGFYEFGRIPLNVISLGGMALLIPFLFAASGGAATFTAPQCVPGMPAPPDGAQPPAPEPIGGWLVLPAIGLILSPILSVGGIVMNLVMFDRLPSRYEGVAAMEIVVGLGLTVFMIVAAVRFFAKKRNTPGTMIALMATALVANGILLLLGIGSGGGEMAGAMALGFVRSLIASAIWIPYFNVSQRVKRTFVVP